MTTRPNIKFSMEISMTRTRNLVGVKFHYNLADSRPEWIVEKKRGRGAWECRVTEASLDWAGRTKVFGTEEIESALAYDEMLNTIGRNNGNWWATARLGRLSITMMHLGAMFAASSSSMAVR